MRIRSLLCKLRQAHDTKLPQLPQTRPLRTLGLNPRVTESSSAKWESPNDSLRMPRIGSVRCMGIGSHKEGNRSGQHGVHYPNAKPDGSPEKQESDARAQFLEKAKAESASNVDGAQERPAGEAATELQFGVKDGKSTDEAIGHASEELFKRSSINAQSSEPTKEEHSEHAEVSSKGWAAKAQEGEAHADVDDSNQVPENLRGQEHDESVLGGPTTHTDEASASGETARENIDKTRSEMRAGKARTPQSGSKQRLGAPTSATTGSIETTAPQLGSIETTIEDRIRYYCSIKTVACPSPLQVTKSESQGVIVGNVPSAGANAIENEGDIPQFSKKQQETGDETLDKAQKAYEKATSGFGTEGDKNVQGKA